MFYCIVFCHELLKSISTELRGETPTKRYRFQVQQHISDQRKERKRRPNIFRPEKTEEQFEEHRQSYTYSMTAKSNMYGQLPL
jgi:hypothetical protein